MPCVCSFSLHSVNTMPENHHVDLIRQTMLKHEDTFRSQVSELHRLYNVQKNLITTLRSETRQQIELVPQATLDINNKYSKYGNNSDIHDYKTGPNDVELTLSIGPSISSRRSHNHRHQTGGNTTIKTSLANSGSSYNQDNKRSIY
ncbi:hypothetical protein R6Q59_013195 [Mikania micrantha]